MKSSFSRSFYPSLIVLVLTLCGVGLLFQIIAKNIAEKEAIERLKTEAYTVSALATAYHTTGYRESDDFFMNLTVATTVSGLDTVICNQQGQLLLCSDAPMGCEHQGLSIHTDYLQKVIQKGCVTDTGKILGLYDDVRLVVSVPIYSKAGGILGIVIASSALDQVLLPLKGIEQVYIVSSLLAAILVTLVMILVARHHSRPLGQMSKTATAFGHGQLDARVEVDPAFPEEIRELAIAFNNMADSLQKSEYSRQEFIANISHELKTPMTTIAGFADGILDGTIPPERQAHYLRLISEETKRLSRLVRSMLDMTRLQESGIPEEQKYRFDMAECAGRVLLSFEQKITAKALNVQVDMPEHPVFTRAHQDHIIQVLYNLLDNAVKFCPESGQLSLRMTTGSNKIYISIANSGQTIPPEELPLMFDRFHKLDKSRSENRDGWGLGLYIVKTIVGAHGENISVSSRDGITEFTFTLPLIN